LRPFIGTWRVGEGLQLAHTQLIPHSVQVPALLEGGPTVIHAGKDAAAVMCGDACLSAGETVQIVVLVLLRAGVVCAVVGVRPIGCTVVSVLRVDQVQAAAIVPALLGGAPEGIECYIERGYRSDLGGDLPRTPVCVYHCVDISDETIMMSERSHS
jgi:hypothetical protein